jgi:subtilisin family serine protease
MKKLIVVLIGSCLLFSEIHAQFTRYVVKLKNKGGNPFSLSTPSAYLSQRAIDRRTRYGIAIDSTDLPVTPSYITQIRNVPNVTLLNVSKWHNSVAIQISDPNAITTINGLSFVQSVAPIAARTQNSTTEKLTIADQPYISSQRVTGVTDFFNYGAGSLAEINLHKGQFLHNIGLRGQGMVIAILDGGFFNYTTLDAMDSIILNNQVLDTWDFYSKNSNVSDDHPHGMQCLSTIAANIPGQFIGKAPKANFLLYRTEDTNSEYPIEEFNMVCGMERADSAGADIISASLGYSEFDDASFNHTYSQMNGNITIAAIGADLAAKKGILFVNAAGNEGSNAWHYIITPADGDSVLAVGAVSTSGAVGSFSSYGPSSDGQVKPDVASVGVGAMVQSTSNTVVTGSGTSFACPNMAGLTSILWQGFPEVNNMRIVRALREAGSIAASPNDRIGYGIPDLKAAFGKLLTEFATSSSTINGCRVFVNWTSKDVGAMKYEIERKALGETNFSKVGELVPTAGVSLATHSYEFINTLATGASGSFSYRIRQIIDTTAATFTAVYVDTTVANLASPCVVTGVVNPGTFNDYVVVRPNPSVGATATLIVESTDAIQSMPILIYNMNGRLVLRLQESKGSGKKNIDLSVGKLAKGKYFINVYNKNVLIGTAEFIRL